MCNMRNFCIMSWEFINVQFAQLLYYVMGVYKGAICATFVLCHGSL